MPNPTHSRKHGAIYVGVTNDIVRRAWEHRERAVEGFTKKYGVKRLVRFEVHAGIETAKRIKDWHRRWKERLVEESNIPIGGICGGS